MNPNLRNELDVNFTLVCLRMYTCVCGSVDIIYGPSGIIVGPVHTVISKTPKTPFSSFRFQSLVLVAPSLFLQVFSQFYSFITQIFGPPVSL